MFPGDIAARIRHAASSVPAAAPVAEINPDPPFSPASRVIARVEEKISDGLFRVLVGGRTMQLALPPDTRVGQELQLQRSGGERRGAWELAPSATPSTRTDVSRAARFVDNLLQRTGAPADLAQGATQLLAAAPDELAAAGSTLPRQLAPALAKALAQSGLFYESHLAEWNAGERSFVSLLQEPQARFAPTTASTAFPATQTAAEVHGAEAEAPRGAAPALDHAANPLADSGVHPDALPLISRQLEALELRQLSWVGELWPGQKLSWDIAEEQEPGRRTGAGRGDNAAQVWRTRLALTLPALGGVTAVLTLQGNTVGIDIRTADAESQSTLLASTPELQGALAAAGLVPQTIGVTHGDAP